MTTVDARGLSCPEPVLMTQDALTSNEAEYTIYVSTSTAKERVTNFAQSKNYDVVCTGAEGDYTLALTKK